MQLRGLEIKSELRLTQPSDALDLNFDLVKSSSVATINPNFYTMIFFDMLNGDITGVDGTPTTGFLAKIYDTADTLRVTCAVDKLDWYENETSYFSEAIMTNSGALGSDYRLRKVEIIFNGNDSDSDSPVVVLTSNSIGTSTYATNDAQPTPVAGILVENANGSLTSTAKFQFIIGK